VDRKIAYREHRNVYKTGAIEGVAVVKLDDAEIEAIASKVYKHNKDATLWDVIVEYISKKGNTEPYILWILSEFEVLHLIAKGFDAPQISRALHIPITTVEKTSKIWGVSCMEQTLDFDPLHVYDEGMTAEDMSNKMFLVSPFVPNIRILKTCVGNIEKYLAVKNLLDEWEEKNE
jgi:hypothetical protein